MGDLIEDILKITGQKKNLRGNIMLQISLDKLKETATKNGLEKSEICTLVSHLGNLADPVARRVVRCLIPKNKTPHEAVTTSLSLMCAEEVSNSLKVSLLKWIVLIYHTIDSKESLQALYAVVFHFLYSEALCPHACHLLYLLTRRCDVKIFRVRILLELQQKKDNPSYIIGLLSVYKAYQPHMVALTLPSSRKSFFKVPDRLWSTQIEEVQERNQKHSGSKNQHQTLEPVSKRAKCHHFQDGLSQQYSAVSDVIDNIDSLELPTRLSNILDKPCLQYALLVSTNRVMAYRLSHFIDHVLYEEYFVQSDRKSDYAKNMLRCLIQISEFLQEGIPICELFLFRYLHTWNGEDNRDYILQLLTRLRLHHFPVLHSYVLIPLKRLFDSSNVYIKCQIILTLTSLLRNMCSTEWPRYQYALQWQERSRVFEHSLSSQDNVASELFPNLFSIFDDTVDHFSALDSIKHLIQYVDKLAYTGLLTEENNTLLNHCVWDFFDIASLCHTKYDLPLIQLPGRNTIYPSLFTKCAVSLDRFCNCMIQYREAFEVMGRKRSELADMWPTDQEMLRLSLNQIHFFNAYILDGCDTLWRYRALISGEERTIFRIFSMEHADAIREIHPNVHQAFSIHFHYALINYVYSFCKTTNQNMTKVKPFAIKPHRDMFVKFLCTKYIGGIKDFLQYSIKRKSTRHT